MEYVKERSWILRSPQRQLVFKVFKDGMIPKQVYQEAKKHNEKMSFNNVSDKLRQFVGMGIMQCLNEEDKMGRIYVLTDIGKEIKENYF